MNLMKYYLLSELLKVSLSAQALEFMMSLWV